GRRRHEVWVVGRRQSRRTIAGPQRGAERHGEEVDAAAWPQTGEERGRLAGDEGKAIELAGAQLRQRQHRLFGTRRDRNPEPREEERRGNRSAVAGRTDADSL